MRRNASQASQASSIAEVMLRSVETVSVDDDASALLDCFSRGAVGLVMDENEKLIGILAKMELVDHLTSVVSPS